MPDEQNNAAQGQAPAGDATAPKTYTQEEWESAQQQIKELRKEAGNYRTERNALNERLEAFKDGATAEDLQKLRNENAQSLERINAAEARAINAEIRAEAARKGFADPDDAVSLIDRSAVKDGNVGELLDRLLKAKPHLKKSAGSVDAGARGGSSKGFNGNDFIRSHLGIGK